MKRILSATGALVVALTCSAGDAGAQTVANGTYYAAPSWNLTLPVHTRFIVLANFNQEAVLDRETGLVWERTPDAAAANWLTARIRCNVKTVGNRSGWRLPTMDELGSLATGSVLPQEHPFIVSDDPGAQDRQYWSSTLTRPDETSAVFLVVSPTPRQGGAVAGFRGWDTSAFYWCVRGGGGDRY